MHPLIGTLPLPHAPVRVHRGALAAHRHSIGPPRCRTFLYRRTLLFDGVGLAGFKSRANAYVLA